MKVKWKNNFQIHFPCTGVNLIIFQVLVQPMLQLWVQSLGREDPLEKELATHSNSLLENPMDGGAYSPRGREESDTTKRLHFTSLLVQDVVLKPKACCCKQSFTETRPHSFKYILWLLLHYQDTIHPTKLKLLVISPFTEKAYQSMVYFNVD